LEEAAAAYEEGIKSAAKLEDKRTVAVGKGQLGTVRMDQGRFDEALEAYEEAMTIFENLGEPATVAGIWHQMGMVHEKTHRFEAAEQAYRKALAIEVQQNNPAGEASSLGQLGHLYNKMRRFEEAVIFFRHAADKHIELKDKANEGRDHQNIAISLIKLKRYDDARQEILRAIECKKPYGHASEPWKTWLNLHNLEQAEGNTEAAAQAREQAIQLFLAYRRDGGENYNPGGRLCAWFENALKEQRPEEIKKQLEEKANDPKTHSSLKPLIPKLQAILDGAREPGLADDPELWYTDAAEILFLLEKMSG